MKAQSQHAAPAPLVLLDQAYIRKTWHGSNLRGALRAVNVDMALWRPQPGRHNIWELVLHLAYWKYVIIRRLTGAKKGSFELDGSNFFPSPDTAGDKEWKATLAFLARYQTELRGVIDEISSGRTRSKHPAKTVDLIIGAASHDVYHTGQIQLIKRMYQHRGDRH